MLATKNACSDKQRSPNCVGEKISPPLAWSGLPEGTKSFALLLFDPEGRAPAGVSHMVVYCIPVPVTGFAEGEVLALVFGAIILGHAGHTERAVEYAERALRFSPLDPWIANSYTAPGIAYCSVGNWGAVALACGKAIEANPRFSLPPVLQAAALSFLGRDAEARASARRVSELEPGFTVSGFVRSHSGRAEIWKPIGDALRRLDLPE